MKIINWERKGNVVRFALGKDDLKDWTYDIYNDVTYGTEQYVDVAFKYDVSLLEVPDHWHYEEDDFKSRKLPILIIDPTGKEESYYEITNKEVVYRIFMGDRFEDISWKLLGGIVMPR